MRSQKTMSVFPSVTALIKTLDDRKQQDLMWLLIGRWWEGDDSVEKTIVSSHPAGQVIMDQIKNGVKKEKKEQ